MQLIDRSFQKNADLAWRIIDGEAFIIHPQQALIYPLNSVATRIWELVDGKNKSVQIINIIQEEFDEDVDVIAQDVSSFFQDLLQADLVSMTDAE